MFPSVKEQIVQLPFIFDLFCRGLIISGLMFGDQPNSIKGVLANNRNCFESWSQIEMADILWAGKLLDYQNAPDLTLTSIKSSECNCLARDLSQVTAFEMDFRICETRTQEEKRPQKINLKKKKEKNTKSDGDTIWQGERLMCWKVVRVLILCI